MTERLRPRNCDRLIALLSLPGLGISTYLSVVALAGKVPACGPSAGCESITASEYAEIAGVPVSLLGMAFYGFSLILALTLDARQASRLRPARAVSLAAAAAALGFTAYLMLVATVIIGAFCLYCTASATLVTLIFLSSLAAWVQTGRSPVSNKPRLGGDAFQKSGWPAHEKPGLSR